MARLKLGPLLDDKPVKLTIELPAAVHRDLLAYAEMLGRESGQARRRSGKVDRANARTLHGDRPSVQGTT